MTKRLSKSQKKLNAAYRSQARSIQRITNMMNDLKRQGFSFNKSFEKSLTVTGTSASKAAQKAERLKGITKTALKEKITGYMTDQGKKLHGKEARTTGMKIERKKKKEVKKRRISSIINIEDSVNTSVDYVLYDESGNHVMKGDEIDVSSIKRQVIDSWDQYRHETPVKQMDVSVLEEFYSAIQPLQEASQQESTYDDAAQRAISILTGSPVSPDDIGNDENIEDIT